MFEFSQSIFFWTLINFGILLFVLYKVALPPFFKLVNDSEKKRDDLMSELEKNHQDSKLLLESYQKKWVQIQEEANKILAEAQKEREEIKKREVEKMIQEKQNMLKGVLSDIEMEKRKILEEVRSQTIDLITAATKAILKKELTPGDHTSLIRSNLQEFELMVK